MNFSPDIADRYDFTVNQFESKKKWLEDLQVIMNERADVEIAYSKSLGKVANLCEKYSTKNNLEKGVAAIVMSVRSVILTQCEQSHQYGQQLKTDVINTLKNGIKKQQDDLKTLQQKVIFLKNELNRYISDLERQKQEYYKNYKLMSRSKEQVLALQLQETNPIMIAVQDNDKLLQSNQKILEDSVLTYNVFLDSYFTEIAQASKIQDMMEDFRVEVIKDSFMKTLVYQISAMKNVEYDTNQVSKKIENYVREDPKPTFIELQERMMLSKLNFSNYISYVQTECVYPHIDKIIQKAEPYQLESMEVNKTLKKFNEMFGAKKQYQFNSQYSPNKTNGQQNQMMSKNQENSQLQENYYRKLLEGIFNKQEYLQNNSIKKFKEMIDQSERELILFTIALHEFSISEIVIKDHIYEKSMSDLIFLVIHVFDKCFIYEFLNKIEQTKESDLIERCLFSFFKICKTYIKEAELQQIFIESLQQHKILSTKDFWVQDCAKKINQAIQRDYGKQQINKARQAEYQIKQMIPKWKSMQFSYELSITILNEIASNFKLEGEKRQFYQNVILEKEKIIKKPIFSESMSIQKKEVNAVQQQEELKQNELKEQKQDQQSQEQEVLQEEIQKQLQDERQEEKLEEKQEEQKIQSNQEGQL